MLDKKLKEILSDKYDIKGEACTIRLNHDGIIAQIKKVFKDEGYYTQHVSSPELTAKNIKAINNMMTGEEWLKRFEEAVDESKEFRRLFLWFGNGYRRHILRAAREASGISEEQNE